MSSPRSRGARSGALVFLLMTALAAGATGCSGGPSGSDLVDPAGDHDAAPPPAVDAAPPPPAHDGGRGDAGADAGRDTDGDGTPDAVDCAPTDPDRYRSVSGLFRDQDGDGYTAGAAQTLCVGSSTAGYVTTSLGEDCDDIDRARFVNVTAYADSDGDGVGAGPAMTQCTAGAPVAPLVASNTDCDALDPTRWQPLPYGYRDADGDGVTVPATGGVCAGATLPPGYANAPSGDDCNDADASVFAQRSLFPDTDGDGVGAGVAQSMCVGATRAGFADTGTDCAPSDRGAWQLLDYAFRDADHDGFTRAEVGQACSGAALPAGFLTVANGDDCDDANAAAHARVTVYADTDGDGAGAGPAILLCNDGSVPPGDSASDTDCAPADRSLWQSLAYAYVDRDGDGATMPESGTQCSGAALAPPYLVKASGRDCDDADATRTGWRAVYPDGDADGAGAGVYRVECLGSTPPAGASFFGDDEDDADPKVGPLDPVDLLDFIL
jgi:hypothetical protein